MTDKRFNYEYVDDKFYDKGFFLDNGKRMFKDGVLNTLNELNDEKEQLKQQIQSIKNVIQQLNDADYYLDSAILDEAMQKIANLIGEEWE